jgi:general secretion pathway protein A
MYNEYFGFAESPFNATSDPRFFYSNRLHQEAFTGLRWGVKLRRGLIVMTGESGTGKTTLLKRVAEGFEPSIRTARISSHHRNFAQMLRRILVNFGLPNPPNNRLIMLEKLRIYLTEQFKENRIVGVLLDEAQDMDVRMLKELELLLDLDIDSQKLLQMVLLASPELDSKLQRPELRSIRQRIALWCRLAPLQSHEVGPYIGYRLMRVGYQDEDLFARGAVEQITHCSRGIPRLINIICDNALLAAYRAGRKSVSPEMIQKVACDLRLTDEFEPKAERSQSGKGRLHSSEPNKEDFKARDAVVENHPTVDEERQWSFEESAIGKKNKPAQFRRDRNFGVVKIAGVLATFLLASSIAVLCFEPSEPRRPENSNIVSAPPTSEPAAENLVPRVFERQSFGQTTPVQVPMPQHTLVEEESQPSPQKTVQAPQNDSLTALRTDQARQRIGQATQKASLGSRKTDEIAAKVFLHTSKEGDRPILEEIGDALRVKGYTIPETRLSSSRTQGDVRFFFSQDSRDADKVKSIVELELRRLGYRISLDVLERDGKKFQFAAPGKIEVWIPPLPSS